MPMHLETLRRTTTATGRAQTGLYQVEGTRLVERALRAGVGLVGVVTTAVYPAQSPRHQTLLNDLATHAVPITHIPPETMGQLTQGRQLGDMMGLVRLPAPADLTTSDPLLLLAAVDVVDPGNVGALVRTGHALGATAVIAIGRSDPFHPKAVRTSMGSLFKMPICHFATATDFLAACQQHQISTAATVATGGVPLPQAHLPQKRLAVLLGNEYWGLPEELLTAVTHHLTIPMADGIDSFSVNAAAAIVLYEMQRKRVEIKRLRD